MARRQYADFSAELALRLGNRTDLTSVMIENFLNDAQQKLALQYEHRCMQATAQELLLINNSTLTPLVATDLWWVEFIRNETDSRGIFLGDKDKIQSQQMRVGIPYNFYNWGGTLYFDRQADVQKTLTLWYLKKLPRFTSGSLPFDENYDVLLSMWAAKIGLETFRDFDEASVLGQQIGMYVAQMRFPLREDKKNDRNQGFKVRTI